MDSKLRFKLNKIVLMAMKIGIGGSLAYYLATLLGLEYAASAGTICLLTLQTTKVETMRLSVRRLLTFFLTFAACAFLAIIIPRSWMDYGLYLFLLVFFCEYIGWRSVVSVNAVTAAHLFAERNFTPDFMVNELLLVVIGVVIAIILNMFHINRHHEAEMVKDMRRIEDEMQQVLLELAGYLRNQSMGKEVWKDIEKMDKELHGLIDLAHEYQNNTFVTHPEYYINYFEMRKTQCVILDNLHSELRRLRHIPKQAETVADYIAYLVQYVHEKNDPQQQIDDLEAILMEMKKQPLPVTREEFESRAMLYHVLMDIEDFLRQKQKFVADINEIQYEIYWKEK